MAVRVGEVGGPSAGRFAERRDDGYALFCEAAHDAVDPSVGQREDDDGRLAGFCFGVREEDQVDIAGGMGDQEVAAVFRPVAGHAIDGEAERVAVEGLGAVDVRHVIDNVSDGVFGEHGRLLCPYPRVCCRGVEICERLITKRCPSGS